MVEDVGVGIKDAIVDPIAAHEWPKVLDRVEFGGAGRQGQQGNVGGY